MKPKWLQDDKAKADATDGQPVRKATLVTKLEDLGTESRRIKFTISTGDVDRDNDTISAAGWVLDNYKQNPVVLWAHSHRDLPIGKAVSIGVEGNALVAVAEFATHPLAQTVYEMLKGGFMRATSVGFRAIEYAINEERRGIDFKRQELLEFSVVPVPANPHALIAASAQGMDLEPLRGWVQDVLEQWPGDLKLKGKVWDKLAASAPQQQPAGGFTTVRTVRVGDVEVTERSNGTGGEILPPTVQEAGPQPWLEANAKLESQVAHLVEQLAAVGQQLSQLRASEPEEEERGVVPKDVSRTAAEQEAEWSAPRLRDFTSEPWVELGASARRSIAGHFAWAAAMPPVAFADLKLAHHRSGDGAVVLAGVRAAAAKLHRAGIPTGDLEGVRAHLSRHYRQFGETAPWDQDGKAWDAYEAAAAGEADDAGLDNALTQLLERGGFAAEAKAVFAASAAHNDDAGWLDIAAADPEGGVVLELADDEEPVFDVSQDELREALGACVRDALSATVADTVTRTVNKMRGRLD